MTNLSYTDKSLHPPSINEAKLDVNPYTISTTWTQLNNDLHITIACDKPKIQIQILGINA